MNIQASYNKEDGTMTFTDVGVYEENELLEYKLEIWNFSHSGNTLLKSGDIGAQVVTYSLQDDSAYRIFVKRSDSNEESDVFCQLHLLNSRSKMIELLKKYLTKEAVLVGYKILKKYIIEAKAEFTKGNYITSNQYINKFNEAYVKINKNI
jgi:hypothetical protein